MKTVYFVRHGETEGNKGNIWQHTDVILTDRGREQARTVAKRFDKLPVDILVTSDFERAHETAKIISEHIGKPVTLEPLFREILRPSAVRGLPKADPEVLKIMQFTEEHWDNAHVKHSDEENFHDLKNRAMRALHFLEVLPEDRILVVTHGTFLTMVVSCMMRGEKLTASEYASCQRFMYPSNTGLSICSCDRKSWTLLTWNDHTHLGD